MAEIPGSVRVAGFLAPTDSTDTYPVTHDTYNKGGYRTVATIAERDAITSERRSLGMMAYVTAEGKAYVLGGSDVDDNTAWVEFSPGGGGNPSSQVIGPFAYAAMTDVPSSGSGVGVTWSYDSGSKTFSVTFDTPQANTNYAVVTDEEFADGTGSRYMMVLNKATTGFDVEMYGSYGPSQDQKIIKVYSETGILNVYGDAAGLGPGGNQFEIQYNDGNGGFGGYTDADARAYLGLEIATTATDAPGRVLLVDSNVNAAPTTGSLLAMSADGTIVAGTALSPAGSTGEIQYNTGSGLGAYDSDAARSYIGVDFAGALSGTTTLTDKVLQTSGDFDAGDTLKIGSSGKIESAGQGSAYTHPTVSLDPADYVNATITTNAEGHVTDAISNTHSTHRLAADVENYANGYVPQPDCRILENTRTAGSGDTNPLHTVYNITTDYAEGGTGSIYGVYYPDPGKYPVGTTFTICYSTALGANWGTDVPVERLEDGNPPGTFQNGDLPDISSSTYHDEDTNLSSYLHTYQRMHRLVLRHDSDDTGGWSPSETKYINGDVTYRDTATVNNVTYNRDAFFLSPGGSVTLCVVEGRVNGGTANDAIAKFWQIIAHYDRDPWANLPVSYPVVIP